VGRHLLLFFYLPLGMASVSISYYSKFFVIADHFDPLLLVLVLFFLPLPPFPWDIDFCFTVVMRPALLLHSRALCRYLLVSQSNGRASPTGNPVQWRQFLPKRRT